MPGRSGNANEYRYGTQGWEKDDEITGVTGSHYTTYFREFDTRLNRTWSVDPSYVAWESPYAVNRNNSIVFNDPMGDWPKWLGGKGKKGGFRSSKRKHKWTGGKKRDNSKVKVDKPKRVKTNQSGFLAKDGRIVTDKYHAKLEEGFGKHPQAEWKKRLLKSIEERIHFEHKPDYYAIHKVPEYGKVEDITFNHEDDLGSNVSMGVWFNGVGVLGGDALKSIMRSVSNPKAGGVFTVVTSVKLEEKIKRIKESIMGDILKDFNESSNAFYRAVEQFNFGRSTFIDFIGISAEAPTYKYQIHVKYKD